MEKLITPNTIQFIDYKENIPYINLNYALNRLLEFIDNFKQEKYDISNQISYKDYFNNLAKYHQKIENLLKDSNLTNSLILFKQSQSLKKQYNDKLQKYIESANKYSLEEKEKIIIEITKNFINKAGIPLLLFYLADKKKLKLAQNIARLLFTNHPQVRFILIVFSCLIFMKDIYINLKDKDKKIEFKNNISIYFGHILCIMDVMDSSYQAAHFINITNEQYGAFRIENINVANNSTISKIVIESCNTRNIFTSFEHLIEFSLSNNKTINTKDICKIDDKNFAQLSLFTGLIGAIYDPLEIQQNPLEYLFIKFHNYVKFNQKINPKNNYIAYNSTITHTTFETSENIEISSAFQHIKNLLLKSHNFILAKTQSFSSVIIYDLLLQSFKISNQNNKPIHKDVLILTTPLHTESFEYKIQKHIKKLCLDNTDTQHNITFMTSICRINKQDYFISLRSNMLEYVRNIDKIVGDDFNNDLLAFLTKQRQVKIKKIFDKILINIGGHLQFKNIDLSELMKFYIDLQDVVSKAELNPWIDRNDTESLIKNVKIKYPKEKNAIKKAFDSIENNFKLLMLCLNDLSILISYFQDTNLLNINDFKKDIENKKNDIEKLLQTHKDNFPANLIRFSQLAIKEYFSLQDIKDSEKLESKILSVYNSKIDNTKDTYKDLFSSIDSINTHIIINIVEKITPIPHSIFTKILSDKAYINFCFIVFVDFAKHNKGHYILSNALFISQTIKITEYEIKNSSNINIEKAFQKALNNIEKTIGDKAIAYFFNKPTLANSSLSAIFGIHKSEEMFQSTIKYLLEIKYDEFFYKININDFKALGLNFIIDFTIDSIFDIIFPNLQRDSLREDIAMLLLSQRRYKPMPYAKWEKDSVYMYVPDSIRQTFVCADFSAMLIGGSPFNSGWCIHNSSLAGFIQNKDLTLIHTLQLLRKYICGKNMKTLSLNTFHTQSDSIFKEAYCKVLHYIGLANKEHTLYLTQRIPNVTIDKINQLFNPKTLIDTKNLIRTKIKKDINASNDDENFIASKPMRYSRDFLIQLKRVAEYNYLIYTNAFDEPNYNGENRQEVELLGSLIYDKDFIPTTIDIQD
ncbi:hypothetical protein DCO58_01475 [Helicobacter saguini]|uniref:Uncharacterized protein n=2 Tax=Helicobacter saguini TaxID=1548018 RepID=A0A4U8SYR3_9HELI|nr:hypothetical protein [Helicobacter saguini]MWV62945.1 hypothetical protein [Helicobacter saguini]MWV66384.1 hypothetical protein [Helicobacter saguini]MWV71711.1 hypothetical protein [Helicobacter saguini]TLD92156.1 hypothetical protein LS64_010720 [Helicobacter saguini]